MNEKEIKSKLSTERSLKDGPILTEEDLKLRPFAIQIIYDMVKKGDLNLDCDGIPFCDFVRTKQFKELGCRFNTKKGIWEYENGEEAMQDMSLFGLFDASDIIQISTRYLISLKYPELRYDEQYNLISDDWRDVWIKMGVEDVSNEINEDVLEESSVQMDDFFESNMDFDGTDKKKKDSSARTAIYNEFLKAFNLTRSSDNAIVRNKALRAILTELKGDEPLCVELVNYVARISKNEGWYDRVRSLYSIVKQIPLFLKNRK